MTAKKKAAVIMHAKVMQLLALFDVETTSMRPHVVVGITADGQDVVEVKFDEDGYIVASDRYPNVLD